ncbi:hypothetical protein ASG43_16730 [Aureimonas sp. Leaf454]|nr:hypothetical protein ASG43_16730 [Aureimonas sp. Leaf454]
MGSLTIRNIDEDLKRKLQVRAARQGLSMEEDLRRVLSGLVAELPSTEKRAAAMEDIVRPPPAIVDETEMRERLARVVALGRRPDEPIDWKAVSDELHDFLP